MENKEVLIENELIGQNPGRLYLVTEQHAAQPGTTATEVQPGASAIVATPGPSATAAQSGALPIVAQPGPSSTAAQSGALAIAAQPGPSATAAQSGALAILAQPGTSATEATRTVIKGKGGNARRIQLVIIRFWTLKKYSLAKNTRIDFY